MYFKFSIIIKKVNKCPSGKKKSPVLYIHSVKETGWDLKVTAEKKRKKKKT